MNKEPLQQEFDAKVAKLMCMHDNAIENMRGLHQADSKRWSEKLEAALRVVIAQPVQSVVEIPIPPLYLADGKTSNPEWLAFKHCTLNPALQSAQPDKSPLAQKDAEITQLQSVLTSALTRMDRARGLLTNDNPRPTCNWGVLDTEDLRKAIVNPTFNTLQMNPMRSESGSNGWYIDGPDFYCDIERKLGEQYSIFIRHKDGTEGFAELPQSVQRSSGNIADFPELQKAIREGLANGSLNVQGEATQQLENPATEETKESYTRHLKSCPCGSCQDDYCLENSGWWIANPGLVSSNLRIKSEAVFVHPVQSVAKDTWESTSVELTAITYEMDVIHERYNGKENRSEREELLTPLRLRCVLVGQRRQALVNPIL